MRARDLREAELKMRSSHLRKMYLLKMTLDEVE